MTQSRKQIRPVWVLGGRSPFRYLCVIESFAVTSDYSLLAPDQSRISDLKKKKKGFPDDSRPGTQTLDVSTFNFG